MASVDTNPKAGKTASLSDGEGEVIDPTPSMSPAQSLHGFEPQEEKQRGFDVKKCSAAKRSTIEGERIGGHKRHAGEEALNPSTKANRWSLLSAKGSRWSLLSYVRLGQSHSKKQVRRLEKEAKRLEKAAKNRQKSQHQGADPEDTDAFRDNYGDAPQYKR